MQDIQEEPRQLRGRLAEDASHDAASQLPGRNVVEAPWSERLAESDDYTIEDWVQRYAEWPRWLNVQYVRGTWHARIQRDIGSVISYVTAGTFQGCIDALEDMVYNDRPEEDRDGQMATARAQETQRGEEREDARQQNGVRVGEGEDAERITVAHFPPFDTVQRGRPL